MDKPTLAYYHTYADQLAVRYEQVHSVAASHFETTFANAGKILDIGCGSGRDLALLTRMGFDTFGVDPSAAMINTAQLTHPELQDRLSVGGLPELGMPFGGKFDGILCYGVLMHLNQAALESSVQSLSACLKSNGRIIIAIPAKKPGIDAQSRDAEGRLFQLHDSQYLKRLFASNGFELIEQWSTQNKIDDSCIEWLAQSYELRLSPAST